MGSLSDVLDPWQTQPEQPVFLGVSTPQAMQAGKEFTARFVAYIKELEPEIEKLLAKLSPRATSALGLRSCRWQLGTQVKVKLQASHLQVASPEQSFTWEGSHNLVEFDVEVPPDTPEGVIVLKFDVSIGDIVIARLRVDLQVLREEPPEGVQFAKGMPARAAFASYASQDRLRVLDRVSEIQRNGVDVFLDCLSLNPGEEWKPRLEEEIRTRDLFILFWSVHAKNSVWVTWEWKTALNHRGVSGIDPHPLDPVSLAQPPEELGSLHFGDPHMLARKAYVDGDASSTAEKKPPEIKG
jgi:hypothetical protein